MSKVYWLLGGALLGAAGLATAALCSEKDSDSGSSTSLNLGDVDALDADGLWQKLNSYCWKTLALSNKQTKLLLELGAVSGPPVELPDDGFFVKAGNKVVGLLTEVSRGGKLDELLGLKKEAEQLYLKHRPVFARANAVLEQHGEQKVSCKGISFSGQDFSLNNDLANDDWLDEFTALTDKVEEYLDKSKAAAELLMSGLERIGGEQAALPSGNAAATA